MLIMSLLVLGIGFLQNIMDLLTNVLNPFSKFGFLTSHDLSMDAFFPCGCKGQNSINWGQRLKPQAHLKRAMAIKAMKDPIVVVLNIRKVVIPCAGMFGIVHVQDVYDRPIDHLYLSISLGVKGSGHGELGVQE